MDTVEKDLENYSQTLKVLYVEDEKFSREALQEVLEGFFLEVVACSDGVEGWEVYQKQKFDIVITDLNMPKMDGFKLIEKIREKNSHQKVLVVSAHNDTQNLLRSINLHIDSFIIKPIEMQQLMTILYKISKSIHAEKILDIYHQELEREIAIKTAKIAKQYVTDMLTGLLNRNALQQQDVLEMQRTLLLINIDNFDTINVTYGFRNGDMVLKKMATFLKHYLKRYNMVLYRIGGDEFAFVLQDGCEEQMYQLAQEIKKDLESLDFQLQNYTTRISCTMAIAKGRNYLLRCAYIALKEARMKGKNQIAIYSKDSVIERLQSKIKNCFPRLKHILQEELIEPYFQAIVNNKTQEILKYECLARMVREDGGVDSPMEFLEVAEHIGIIPEITHLMIEKSFAFFALNQYEFSINISEYDLNDGYLRNFLLQKAKYYNIDPSRVVLEVLEGVSAEGAHNSIEQLNALKKDGFRVAIDDFGVQNSNFERVHDMQVDYIKIDGKFIKNIDTDMKSYNVAKTITEFAKSIGAQVVAEFVHSQEVYDVVCSLEIDYSQGYYFSKPLSAKELLS
jgi:diguanylate cyclase (GGDEF)-like protein